MNVKAHYSFSKKDKLYLSYYRGQDSFQDETNTVTIDPFNEVPTNEPIQNDQENEYFTNWGNQIFSLRWNRLYGDRLFSNTTGTFSEFNYLGQQTFGIGITFMEEAIQAFKVQSTFSSVIKDYSLRTDFDYFLNNQNVLKFGAKAIRRIFIPGITEEEVEGIELIDLESFSSNQFSNEEIPTTELSTYIEESYTNDNLSITAGINLAFYLSDLNSYVIPQPRLSAIYEFNNGLATNLTATRSTQFLQLLTKTDSGLPNDLWVPTSEDTDPQDAWQFTAGVSGRVTNNINWKSEAYWKKLNNLQRLSPDYANESSGLFLLIDGSNWSSFTENGEGVAYGIETTLSKEQGLLTGWLSYSWANANRSFEGAETPFPFDTRHNITAVTTYPINDWLNLSANWQFQSRSPVAENNLSPIDIPFLPILETNATAIRDGKLPAYHRLDINANLHFKQNNFRHELNLGIYNAYNRKNVAFALNSAIDGTVGLNGLPILPSLSYKVAW